MIKNLLKIAFRNIWHNKVLASINIFGLAIGISATMLIATIIFYELSYDDFHNDRERIFRIVTEASTTDDKFYNKGVPAPLGKTIKDRIAGIEAKAVFHTIGKDKVENKDANLVFQNPEKIVYADKSFFDIFQYDVVAGDFSNILTNPNEVVLTRKRAGKYFPNISPYRAIGKTLIYNDTIPVTVVGIVSDIVKTTDLYFQEFISSESAVNFGEQNLVESEDWFNSSSSTQVFIKIDKKISAQAIEDGLMQIAKEHAHSKTLEYSKNTRFLLQPFSDLHFNSKYGAFDDSEYLGNRSFLLGLSLIAIFLLLLSCINFVNLNTAQGIKRSKEIGIRKTLGGSRRQLIFQFLGEAFFLTIISAVFSLFISAALIHIFDDMLPGKLDYSILASYRFIIFNFILIVVVAFMSGFYPAIILSNYKPTSVLKNTINFGKRKTSFRKSLTIFQLVVAQLFIISTIIIGNQVYYLINKDIGFKTDSVVNLRLNEIPDINKRLIFARELKQIPSIKAVSLGSGSPFQAMMGFPMKFKKNDGETTVFAIKLDGDLEYRSLFEI
ncbi:MAG: ABC transporter permease, partial [Oleispira sp.]|nr:ABC transporter permease [Oleispira sp.]